jgi:branched-chain amino acid aminotransferase
MDRLIYHNGRLVDATSARLAPTNAGALYGWGVFTTIRIFEGAVFAFDRHWDRLRRHAEQAEIAFPLGPDEARRALVGLVAANSTRNGRARITVLRGNAGAWRQEPVPESEILMFTTVDAPRPLDGLAITVSPYRVLSHGPLAGVKRTAMLENLLALEEARSRNFSEAVMFNERGEIVGGAAANIFWAVGDELLTPSIATGCVAGITRELVLDIARRLNLRVIEGSFPVQRLLDAHEAFLTSTARGVAPVATFDIKEYAAGGAWVTKLIEREFQKLIQSVKM